MNRWWLVTVSFSTISQLAKDNIDFKKEFTIFAFDAISADVFAHAHLLNYLRANEITDFVPESDHYSIHEMTPEEVTSYGL
jgi:hypothetical protein